MGKEYDASTKAIEKTKSATSRFSRELLQIGEELNDEMWEEHPHRAPFTEKDMEEYEIKKSRNIKIALIFVFGNLGMGFIVAVLGYLASIGVI